MEMINLHQTVSGCVAGLFCKGGNVLMLISFHPTYSWKTVISTMDSLGWLTQFSWMEVDDVIFSWQLFTHQPLLASSPLTAVCFTVFLLTCFVRGSQVLRSKIDFFPPSYQAEITCPFGLLQLTVESFRGTCQGPCVAVFCTNSELGCSGVPISLPP